MLESILLYLSDFLMFMPETWARLVARYYHDMWPTPVFTVLLGGFLLWLIYYRPRHSDRMINVGLCACWLWVGLVFHFQYFTTISWAAWGFGGLFILQALLLLCFGVVFEKIQYQSPALHTAVNRAGIVIIVFALLAMPLISAIQAGDWSQAKIFGFSADATCLATIGFILSAKPGARGVWLILPIVWGFISLAQYLAVMQGEMM